MSWLYRLFKRNDTETTVTVDPTVSLQFNATGNTLQQIYMNKLAATGPSLRVHNHLYTSEDGAIVSNEFKGEFLASAGTMDGVFSEFKLNLSSSGVMRAVFGAAYQKAGTTLSGSNSMLAGGVFVALPQGTLNGAGVDIVGVYGEVNTDAGCTITAVNHMCAVWAASRIVNWGAPGGAGQSECLLLTHGSTAGNWLNQAIYVYGSDHIYYFLTTVSCAGMTAIRSTPNQTATCDGYLRVYVGGKELYIPLYNGCTIT